MRLLLDTHAFLWFVNGDDRLLPFARSAIEDAGNEAFISTASVWEVAIKHRLNKLRLTEPIDEFFAKELNGFGVLPITLQHAVRTANLPFHHRDPFDRLLVAVCQEDSLPIVSADAVFDSYGIDRLWKVPAA